MKNILLIVYDSEYRTFLRRVVLVGDPDYPVVAHLHGRSEDELGPLQRAFVDRIRDRYAWMKPMVNPLSLVDSYLVICLAI